MSHLEKSNENIVRSKLPPLEYPNISVGEYLAKIIQNNLSKIAFLDPDHGFRPITYGEFHHQIQEFACGLLDLGVTSDDLMAYFCDNCHQFTTSWFASLYLGLSVFQVGPSMGPYEFANQIAETKASVLLLGPNQMSVFGKVLASEKNRECLKQFKLIVLLQFGENDEMLGKSENIVTFDQIVQLGSGKRLNSIPHFPIDNSKQKPMAIYYTSGTSGKSKGVIHSHGSFLASLINLKYSAQFDGMRILLCNPLGHISGSHYLPIALSQGMTVVLLSKASFDAIFETIHKYRINLYILMGKAKALIQNEYYLKYDLSCLKAIYHGGSKLDADLLRSIKHKYNTRMYEVYASSEIAGMVSLTEHADSFENYQPGNVGNVQRNVEMKIVDLNNGLSLLAYQKGEICFRGATCFVEYLNDKEETRKAIDADGWFHTGDVGHYDSRGCLFLTDRIKEIIKWTVYSVFPVEIEHFIARHEAVLAVCVVGVPHSTDGQVVRAYVQLKAGLTLMEQDLIDFVQNNIANHKWLRGGVRFVDEMPQTVIGKIDRQYFKRLVQDELITQQDY